MLGVFAEQRGGWCGWNRVSKGESRGDEGGSCRALWTRGITLGEVRALKGAGD